MMPFKLPRITSFPKSDPPEPLETSSGFPRELFWPALKIYREMHVQAGITALLFFVQGDQIFFTGII